MPSASMNLMLLSDRRQNYWEGGVGWGDYRNFVLTSSKHTIILLQWVRLTAKFLVAVILVLVVYEVLNLLTNSPIDLK